MPTYDYQCRNCGAVTEVIHAMTDPGPAACGRCGGALRRVLYPSGIIFKGSGFYRTDSRATTGGAGDAAATTGKGEGVGADTPSTPAKPSGEAPAAGGSPAD